MKNKYKIAILVTIALLGFLLWGGSIWYWIVGVSIAYIVFTLFKGLLLFIMAIATLFGILFWILIS